MHKFKCHSNNGRQHNDAAKWTGTQPGRAGEGVPAAAAAAGAEAGVGVGVAVEPASHFGANLSYRENTI